MGQIMTMSKKLLIAGVLMLGMQHTTHAFNDSTLNERTEILTFAQELRQVNHKEALNVAQWLEQQACKPSYNVSDHDLSTIINVINNDNLTMQSKISALLQTKANQRKQYIKNIAEQIAGAVLFSAMFSSVIALAVYDAKYLAPLRPRMSITLSSSSPSFHKFWRQDINGFWYTNQ
jgi:hypothetical protein